MKYLCKCGEEFEHHQERTMHMGTCVRVQRAKPIADVSLFKPSDFAQVGWKPGQEEHAAQIANERIAPLIEALRFYANERNWEERDLSNGLSVSGIANDGGEHARKALGEE